MKSYKISQYRDAGCNQMNDRTMFGVHGITGGKVCDTGCALFNGGRCSAYLKLIRERKADTQPTETVKEEAKRTGLSISKVRKYRRDGYPGKQ